MTLLKLAFLSFFYTTPAVTAPAVFCPDCKPIHSVGAFTAEEQAYCYNYEPEPFDHWDKKEKEALEAGRTGHRRLSVLKDVLELQDNRLKGLQEFRRSICLELRGVRTRSDAFLRKIQEQHSCKMSESIKVEYGQVEEILNRFRVLLRGRYVKLADLDSEGYERNLAAIRKLLALKKITQAESDSLHAESFLIWAQAKPEAQFRKQVVGIMAERARLADRLEQIHRMLTVMAGNTKSCATAGSIPTR